MVCTDRSSWLNLQLNCSRIWGGDLIENCKLNLCSIVHLDISTIVQFNMFALVQLNKSTLVKLNICLHLNNQKFSTWTKMFWDLYTWLCVKMCAVSFWVEGFVVQFYSESIQGCSFWMLALHLNSAFFVHIVWC